VGIHHQAVLFSGPSGAGKSTMAELWHTHLDADVLNGDRAVIQKSAGCFTAAGSMWAGSSQIYRRDRLPIRGVFLVTQAPENRVERLGFDAFIPLFSQTILNSWDPQYMAQITALYAEFMEKIPVYRLYCRPDRQAVELAYQTLFGKEPSV
jgi:Fe-S cluster assembly ATPase SufC